MSPRPENGRMNIVFVCGAIYIAHTAVHRDCRPCPIRPTHYPLSTPGTEKSASSFYYFCFVNMHIYPTRESDQVMSKFYISNSTIQCERVSCLLNNVMYYSQAQYFESPVQN